MLEMSLKPFRDASPRTRAAVCRTMFEQWKPLYSGAKQVSVMLWASDGSEILDYAGKPADKFEWAKYIGVANPRNETDRRYDPDGKGIHMAPVPYMKNPPSFTYAWLKGLVREIKKTGRKYTGSPVKVVATFDPGPEFAKSSFKYERHNEICMADSLGKASFVCCYAELKGDGRRYAGFPEGIPEGTSIGTFLGRQCARFLPDMGFDAVWLSNGFGFGLETWSYTGALFDGRKFDAKNAPETRKKVLDFWKDFKKECKYPVQTRGSNFPTGVEVASDAVPVKEIYRKYKPQVPPNSPWAAINGDFGIELCGWMSHIAELPARSYIYRFYAHDPWFKNSPWLDRYNRESHDIYLPLSVSRIDANGRINNPDIVSILTVDDSYGRMPEKVPNEIIPRMLEGFEHAPDAPGPLVWVYPFGEYDSLVSRGERLDGIFFSDWFICAAINRGFPVNTVVSTANFIKTIKKNRGLYAESVLVVPAAVVSPACAEVIVKHVKKGGRALFYGPVAGDNSVIRELLGLEKASPLEGEFSVSADGWPDTFRTGVMPAVMSHGSVLSGGTLEDIVPDAAGPGTRVLASAEQDGESRVTALSRALPGWNGGRAAWVRGSVSADNPEGARKPVSLDPVKYFYPEVLMRYALREFGWELAYDKYSPAGRDPIIMISRHDNAFYFSGFGPDTTASGRFRAPAGVPLFTGTETVVENGTSSYPALKSWHRECRVFIEQEEPGHAACAENTAEQPGYRRRIMLSGLKNAVVRFFYEPGTEKKVSFLVDPHPPFLGGDFRKPESIKGSGGKYLQVRGISGRMLISW